MEINQIDYSDENEFVNLKTGYSYTELFKFSGFDCKGYGCEKESCILNVEYNGKYKRKSHPRLTIRANKNGKIVLVCYDFET